ncbi:hypothetical protein K4K48_007180 [Colletotrichum sp. SAR 10_66]|nr:hypothetical protein K4K48_007180 [Colletotrichum sp. SAR 10_66]
MEALAAVSLAGNVAQFLEFGLKAVATTHELLRNPDGTLQENIDLQNIAQSTKSGFADKLRELQLGAIAAEVVCSLDKVEEDKKGRDEFLSSLELPLPASRAAENAILGILDGLKASTTRREGLYLKITIVSKTLWKRSELKELHERLNALRSQVSAHLVVLLLQQQQFMAQDLRAISTQNARLRTEMGGKLEQVISHIRTISNQRLNIEDYVPRPRNAKNPKDSKETSGDPNKPRASSNSNDGDETMEGYPPKSTLDDVFHYLNQTLTSEKRKAILGTLYFNQLEEREVTLPETHRRTFEWIFEGSPTASGTGKASDTFTRWLQHHAGIFWVTGKAGSGKSTLMKFLTHHDETKRLLGVWADKSDLVIAQHYFWSPGTTIQKSQEGLLRALLLQIFKQRTNLMRIACPDRWNFRYADSFHPWSRTQLMAAFEKLGKHPEGKWRICLFIDGLDEYSGDHTDLVKLILRMGELPNIKICVSSRPWIEFSDAFENTEWKLHLHDLSQADIHTFIRDELQGNGRFRRLRSLNEGDAESLALEIVARAQGVFLWVFLVVRSLLEGLRNEDDIHDLRMRLRALPTGLKDMFRRMLDTIDEFYRKRTSRLFLTMTHAETSFPVLAFYFMEFEDKTLPKEPLPFLRHWPNVDMGNEWARALDRKKRQLVGQCKDLIFISPIPDAPDLFNERVGFLHRTVVDYIKSKDVRARLQHTAEDFNPDRILLGAHVGQLRSLIHQHRNNYIRPHLAQWMLGALYYARRIEILTGIPEVEALDDLEAIIMSAFGKWGFSHAMATLLPGNDDWNEDAPESSFLELVCRYDVALYVVSKVPDLNIERLDDLAPKWKARISINRGSGFELRQLASEDDEDEWRLRKEVRASSQTKPAEVDLPTATTLEVARLPKISIVVAKERFEVAENGKRKRGRFASKLKGIFRKR